MDGTAQRVLGTMLDHAVYPTPHRLTAARMTDNLVQLHWSDGRISRFHAVWLRDNCPCPICRHPHALERRVLFLHHPEPPRGVGAEIDGGGVTGAVAGVDG